ncbi:lytic polysaccharide monooxygenase auxiliary activity family 9 protein [Actinokineospora iranica]|uniref:Chitin binding domain-containing protein n=1 Tax=Actinokineospora iranica TaxID=1271860 RepID=A0A1G6U2B4_9PSEU|nr:lytic polysaccharide monooxygenase auxiliary activity family 9 protein [Actinokineospora iranica]SDD35542.1 Chitin binding domain-containing protein [Actinokineospora iranica]
MTADIQQTAPPRSLAATAAHRTDGDLTLHGIQLAWTVGANSGDDWPPPADWNDGVNPPYPHVYEVWLNGGEIKQTAGLYWPTWSPGWQWARAHWVCLGAEPASEYRVKIRAKLDGGAWSEFTDEVTVATADTQPYAALPARQETTVSASPRHGSVDHPVSRAVRVIRDNDPAEICRRARELNTSSTWQEVVPPADAMLADPPWNGSYLEYRKFFHGPDVASAGNAAFAGLDLVGDWPVTYLAGGETTHTFSYAYTAHHVDHTWTHQWFVTKDGWDRQGGVTWDALEPVPFMTETHGDPAVTSYTTETLPAKTGKHVIVNVWGGHGGPRDQHGNLVGEFFMSCSDVEFD